MRPRKVTYPCDRRLSRHSGAAFPSVGPTERPAFNIARILARQSRGYRRRLTEGKSCRRAERKQPDRSVRAPIYFSNTLNLLVIYSRSIVARSLLFSSQLIVRGRQCL